VIVDIQFNQGSAPWPVVRDAVLAAEEAGYSRAWNLDHFSGAMFSSESMDECFSSLTAWAAVTTRIGLGTLVANVNNRVPALLANAAATVQNISDGRLMLGLGAGASPTSPWGAEHRAIGMELLPTRARRHDRFLEVVGEVRGIWAPGRTETLTGFPLPDPAPRIIAGVNSESLARIAGRHLDGINVRAGHPERARLLGVAREEAGERADFDVSVWEFWSPELADPGHAFHAEMARDGVNRVILLVQGAPDPAAIAATRQR
jgi:alkanesulfonate monooxygenase SsuD/methylene tetrahydromethanopterin reductase-like flavin-dependent oxidoreductase (luciferase family)